MLASILQSIGRTPLLRLNLSRDLPGTVWLKLENCNPGGSVKDRTAFNCIQRAQTRGDLKKGGSMVAPTSGNMGIGMAMLAAAKGFGCILTMPESMSRERRQLLRGYGAELFLTPAAEGMAGAVREARRIAKERGAWLLDQFSNKDMVSAHYETTGPEIFYDSSGKMDVLVAGVGTGATLTGTGLYLKESIPGFRVIAVEPEDSPVLSGGQPGSHVIQGIGAGFVPDLLDRSLLDEIILANGREAIDMARKLMATDAVCAGISTGANVAAAVAVARRPEMEGADIVTFACDTGERYLSMNLFSED